MLKDGIVELGECLFLEGPRNTTVNIEYRAKHPESRFLYRHDLRWKRGLFTGWNNWVAWNALNADPSTSPPRTYDQLLDTFSQCAFSIEVRSQAKITNGAGRITGYDDRDNGAFAINSPV